jgi:SprT-like family
MTLRAIYEKITQQELQSVNDDFVNALQNKDWNTTYYPLIMKGIKDGTLDLATLKQWIKLAKVSQPGLDISTVPNDLKEMFHWLNGKYFAGDIPSFIPVNFERLGYSDGLTESTLEVESDKNGQMLKDSEDRPIYKVDANGQPIAVISSIKIRISEKYKPNSNVSYSNDMKNKVICILLHEMVHAYFFSHGKPAEGHHSNFKQKLRAISNQTGLPWDDLLGGYQPDMDEP